MSTTSLDHRMRKIYDHHAAALLRTLLNWTYGDWQAAEDLMQETMLRAWRHLETLDTDPQALRPWLFTVARRIAIDHLRMAAARAKEVTDEAPEERRDATDAYEGVLAARDMAAALSVLQPHHRDVLVELHLRDRSVAQAAEVLGIPAGTVKSRNFYAIRALRPVLESQQVRESRPVLENRHAAA